MRVENERVPHLIMRDKKQLPRTAGLSFSTLVTSVISPKLNIPPISVFCILGPVGDESRQQTLVHRYHCVQPLELVLRLNMTQS